MTTSVRRPPRPTRSEFVHELAAVATDIPRFILAPLHRFRHQRWGATDAEVHAAMPGDDVVARAQYQCTRAVTIKAKPESVWPWLVQVGCLRAGFYADDLLDNLGQPSARAILPEFQRIEVGQWVPMSPSPTEVTAFKVAGFERNRYLLWEQPISTWAWCLSEGEDGTTRLVTRIRIFYDWRRPASALFSLLLNEFGDYPMMRRMLLGIKERAEGMARQATAIPKQCERVVDRSPSRDI